jgi:GrpB-like predicted nucleotidyltransferase (UPF0157 family)
MTLRFRPESELWPLVDRAFQRHSREIRTLVPSAQVEHIGATSIPGSLTKGDVDLLVRVPKDDFGSAITALGGQYAVAQPDNWTETFASFAEERDGELPVGVQLVIAGSAADTRFVSLRRLLRTRPDFVERSNDLKRRYEGGDPDAYSDAKQALYEELLRARESRAAP